MNDIPYVEAHTHLDHYNAEELAQVLTAYDEMPCRSWAVTIDFESWERVQELVQNRPDILATFGIHPWEAHRYQNQLDEIDERLAQSLHVGEIGLDFVWVKEKERWPIQIAIFEHQLKHAAAHNKIVNLHTKGAEQLTADKLRQFKVERALVHWYSGPMEPLADLIDLGCYFSFGVEMPRSEPIQSLAKYCPLDRILTETDGPGALEWLAGRRGTPGAIPGIVETLARIKAIPTDQMKAQIWTNYQSLINPQ